MKKEKGGKKV